METAVETRSLALESQVEETKDLFELELKRALNLVRVGAPLYVPKSSGLNDDLNGYEKPVSFKVKEETYEVVHSLAKWKRWYLGKLGVRPGQGIVTNMTAIRVDEVLSPIHSHLVDQWDWEKVIDKGDRKLSTLVEHGKAVYEVLRMVEKIVSMRNGEIPTLSSELKIIHAEDLYLRYPKLSSKEREHAIAKEFGAVLLIGIGGALSSGEPHDLRAPDYDDWSTRDEKGRPGLNADLIVWDAQRQLSLEISSMGVRVDEEALKLQLAEHGVTDRLEKPFHRALIAGKLPYTIGGGIGKSRVAMFVTRQSEISAVQPICN